MFSKLSHYANYEVKKLKDAMLYLYYLRYKTITFQNASEAQVKNFFYFIEKLCTVHKIFKVLCIKRSHDLNL